MNEEQLTMHASIQEFINLTTNVDVELGIPVTKMCASMCVYMCVHVCVCVRMRASGYMWRRSKEGMDKLHSECTSDSHN